MLAVVHLGLDAFGSPTEGGLGRAHGASLFDDLSHGKRGLARDVQLGAGHAVIGAAV